MSKRKIDKGRKSVTLKITYNKFIEIMNSILEKVEISIMDDEEPLNNKVTTTYNNDYNKVMRHNIIYYENYNGNIKRNDNDRYENYCISYNNNTTTFIIGEYSYEAFNCIDFKSNASFKEFVDDFIQYCNDRRHGNHDFNTVFIDYRYTLPNGNSIALTRLNPADNTHYMIYYFDSMHNDVKNAEMYLPNEMLYRIFIDIQKNF